MSTRTSRLEIVADQNIDQPIIDRLRSDGHSVFSIRDRFPGIDDEQVLALSVQRNALLLTEDKGFGNRVFLQKSPARGVVLLRIIDISSGKTADQIAVQVVDIVRQYGKNLFGQFTVITDHGVRQQRLP